MKVLCLNPPFKTEHGRFSRTSRSPAITKSGTIYYPIWLCYAAASIEETGHDVSVIDSCANEYDLAKTLDMVNELRPELVIIDTSTPSIFSDVKTGAEIKKILPDSFVVLMGTHPSALPEDTLTLHESIDAVAVGEADLTMRHLADVLVEVALRELNSEPSLRRSVLSKVEGLVFRVDKEIVHNPKRDLIRNLDDLPFVSKIYKKYLDVNKYFFAACDYPEIQIMTSRGCIAKCTFCVYPQTIHGQEYRARSAKSVADEFQWICDNLPEVREIGIEDDVFSGNQKRVVDFCKEIVERRIKLKWYCNVRVDLKFETMQWMKKAGCVLVTVGYESANQRILENINKKITPQMIREFSKNTRRSGLLVHGCFMAGNRGETRETLDESLQLALTMMDDTMQFFPLMVYPGTKDYDWAIKEGLYTAADFSDYVTEDGCHNSVLNMQDMNSEEIRLWCDYARRKYYLRPRYIYYKLMQQIKNPSEIRRTFKAAKRFVRFLVPSTA